jgi:hypothetical protein
VGKQYYNFRLAPEDISDSLSGFRHNAVTPVGMATPLPIIVSHKIAMLQPDFFWLVRGGDESQHVLAQPACMHDQTCLRRIYRKRIPRNMSPTLLRGAGRWTSSSAYRRQNSSEHMLHLWLTAHMTDWNVVLKNITQDLERNLL